MMEKLFFISFNEKGARAEQKNSFYYLNKKYASFFTVDCFNECVMKMLSFK